MNDRLSDRVASYLEGVTDEGDAILVMSPFYTFPLERYYDGPSRVIGFDPTSMVSATEVDYLESVSKGGGVSVNHKNIKLLDAFVDPYKKIYYYRANPTSDPHDLTFERLITTRVVVDTIHWAEIVGYEKDKVNSGVAIWVFEKS